MSRSPGNNKPEDQPTVLYSQVHLRSGDAQLPSPVQENGPKYFRVPGYAIGLSNRPWVHILHSEVLKQVKTAAKLSGTRKFGHKHCYPHRFWNHNQQLVINFPKPWVIYPIFVPGHEPANGLPGALRALYNEDDRSNFNLVYHDDKRDYFENSEFRPFSVAALVSR